MALSWFGIQRAVAKNTLYQVNDLTVYWQKVETLIKITGFLYAVRVYDEIKHYRVRTQTSENGDSPVYFISRRTQFPSLQELVEHYSFNGDGLCITLTQPCVQVICRAS